MEIDNSIYKGCMPALMTPCDDKGQPLFDELVQKAQELIDLGMRAVVYCGSMGEWPLLTDDQRMEGVDRLVDAGIPVIAGTGAQSTKLAVAHATHAREVGAAGLMLIPRVLSRVGSIPAQKDHFAALLEAGGDLPAVIYNSPHYGFLTDADLFFDLHQHYPQLVGFKEFGGAEALSYAAEYMTTGNPDLVLMVGVDTQVYHGYVNCGCEGAITGVGNALPREVLHYIKLCQKAAAGDCLARRKAAELSDALAVLSKFDEGGDLVLYYKHMMVLEGNPEYQYLLNTYDRLAPTQKAFFEKQWKLFRAWWEQWDGKDL